MNRERLPRRGSVRQAIRSSRGARQGQDHFPEHGLQERLLEFPARHGCRPDADSGSRQRSCGCRGADRGRSRTPDNFSAQRADSMPRLSQAPRLGASGPSTTLWVTRYALVDKGDFVKGPRGMAGVVRLSREAWAMIPDSVAIHKKSRKNLLSALARDRGIRARPPGPERTMPTSGTCTKGRDERHGPIMSVRVVTLPRGTGPT